MTECDLQYAVFFFDLNYCAISCYNYYRKNFFLSRLDEVPLGDFFFFEFFEKIVFKFNFFDFIIIIIIIIFIF